MQAKRSAVWTGLGESNIPANPYQSNTEDRVGYPRAPCQNSIGLSQEESEHAI